MNFPIFGRRQCAKERNSFFRWAPIISLAPKDTVLSPVLYNATTAHIKDIITNPETKLVLYAEDILLIKSLIDAEGKTFLQTDCDAIVNFLNLEGLEVSSTKTKILIVSVSAREIQPSNKPLKMNGVQVEEVDVLKYLGVDLDKHINFIHHSMRAANKARRMLHAIRNSPRKWHMRDEIKILCVTCIRPVLTYGISIAYGKSQEGKSALERINRIASRMILNNYTAEYQDLLKILDWPTIAWMSVEERLRVMHRLSTSESRSDYPSNNQPIQEIIVEVT
jgi:hypothetical protein